MVMSFNWNWSGWPYRFYIVNALFLSMQFYGCTFLTKLHPVLLSRQDRKLQETSTRNIGNFWHNTNYEGHYKTALWNTDQRFILLTDTAKEVCKFKWEMHRKTNRHQDNSCFRINLCSLLSGYSRVVEQQHCCKDKVSIADIGLQCSVILICNHNMLW